MKRLTNEEVKQRELAILCKIDEFCKKNHLTYFLNYGTLIGVIRHQGFIPWDDDIDLMMPREDYERFCKEFKSETLRILSYDTDTRYFNNFLKVVDTKTTIVDTRSRKTYQSGIFVDIFPYDTVNDLSIVKKTYQLESFKLLSFSKYKNIVFGDNLVKDVIRTISWLALTPVSPRWFTKKIQTIVSEASDKNGKWNGVFGASKWAEKEVFPKGIFDELTTGMFEGYQFPIPKNYDTILTQYYGDYMQLPPKEQQINPHELEVYWTK